MCAMSCLEHSGCPPGRGARAGCWHAGWVPGVHLAASRSALCSAAQNPDREHAAKIRGTPLSFVPAGHLMALWDCMCRRQGSAEGFSCPWPRERSVVEFQLTLFQTAAVYHCFVCCIPARRRPQSQLQHGLGALDKRKSLCRLKRCARTRPEWRTNFDSCTTKNTCP